MSKNMRESLENQLRQLPNAYLTDNEIATLLSKVSDHSRYGKVKRLIAQGKLLALRRGLYCKSPKLGSQEQIHPFELAQIIYAPSYISLESALSYHQLIPEQVVTITSVCAKRSKSFMTPLGRFDYLHLPIENFYTEMEIIRADRSRFMMAKPWKAICDYIYCYKKEWKNLDPVWKSLRIEPFDLPLLTENEIHILNDYYHHRRLTRFLNGVRRTFNL